MALFQLSEAAISRLKAELRKDGERRQAPWALRALVGFLDPTTAGPSADEPQRLEAQGREAPHREAHHAAKPGPLRLGTFVAGGTSVGGGDSLSESRAVQRDPSTQVRVPAALARLEARSRRSSIFAGRSWRELRHQLPPAPGRSRYKLGALASGLGVVLIAAMVGDQVWVRGFAPAPSAPSAGGSPSDPVGRYLLASGEAAPARGDLVPIAVERIGQSEPPASATPSEPEASASIASATPPAPADQLATIDRRELDSETIRLLMQRGRQLFVAGDVASARVVFERAAEGGDAAAAVAVGATYDPAMLAKFRIYGVRPDVDKARVWYEKAAELGSIEAPSRLKLLAKQ